MIQLSLNKLSFTICLIFCMELYAKAGVMPSKGFRLSSFFQYQSSNYFLKYNSSYLFQNHLSYQNQPSIERVNFCDFLLYGDDIQMRWIMKQVFGPLPEHVPHLPLSRSEEDFPIKYWIYEDTSEAQRHLVHQVVEEINIELGFRAFVIAGVDSGEINFIDNQKDQKNVIYLLDEEEMSTLLSDLSYTSDQITLQGPGTTIQIPVLDILTSSFYPIVDADIIINKDFSTDLGAFRSYLVTHLKQVGIENHPLNANVTHLHDLLIRHLENIDAEEYRNLLVESLTQERQVTERSSNAIRDEIGLTEEEERNLNQLFAQTDRAILFFSSINPSFLLAHARNFKEVFTSADVPRFQESSSSILFKNLLKHELLHALGINHYTGIIVSDSKPLMNPSIVDFFRENAFIPGQVDFYALESLSCTYDLEQLRQRHPL